MVLTTHRGTPFMQAVTSTAGTFTVPARQTLVLTGVRLDVPTTAATNTMTFMGATLYAITTITAVGSLDGHEALTPMPIKSGTVLTFQTSAGATGTLEGYLVDET
jgi:hypothetical protein